MTPCGPDDGDRGPDGFRGRDAIQYPNTFRGPSTPGYWLDEAHRDKLSVEMDFKITEDNKEAVALMAGVELEPDEPASAIFDHIVAENMRAYLAKEEEVARTALELGCGYAVIEEVEPVAFAGASNTYSSVTTTTTTFILSGFIPKMQRYAFPSWDAFNAWRGRQL